MDELSASQPISDEDKITEDTQQITPVESPTATEHASQREIEQLRATIDQLEKVNESQKDEIQKLTNDKNKSDLDKNKQRDLLRRVSEELKKINDNKKELSAENASLKQEILSLKQDILSLKQQFEKTDVEKNLLQENISNLVKEKISLEQEITRLNQEEYKSNEILQEKEKKIIELSQEIEQNKEKFQNEIATTAETLVREEVNKVVQSLNKVHREKQREYDERILNLQKQKQVLNEEFSSYRVRAQALINNNSSNSENIPNNNESGGSPDESVDHVKNSVEDEGRHVKEHVRTYEGEKSVEGDLGGNAAEKRELIVDSTERSVTEKPPHEVDASSRQQIEQLMRTNTKLKQRVERLTRMSAGDGIQWQQKMTLLEGQIAQLQKELQEKKLTRRNSSASFYRKT